MSVPRLELRGITKRYRAVIANEESSLRVMPGEIHAVLGENGAGKTTLMKIIYGALAADAGAIVWNGTPVTIASPAAARRLGIAMVYQHFSLFESVTVAENIAVASSGKFDLAATAREIETLSRRYDMPIDPRRLVRTLSVGEKQRVEILRCLMRRPELLILDEPTSVLPPAAIKRLFEMLRQLAGEGCSILYISHKLDEIRALCDSATVLRGGRVVGTPDPKNSSTEMLARLMVGTGVAEVQRPAAAGDTRPRLEIVDLSARSPGSFGIALQNVALSVHGGEIVGIAGVSGNGQAELVQLLSGERTLPSAEMIRLDDKPIANLDVAARRRMGLCLVPEERLGRGAVPSLTLVENVLLTARRQSLVRYGIVDRRKATDLTQRIIDRFGVRCSGPNALAASLSGGNLQKFIVGREIMLAPGVLVIAQPTWGVDVTAAAFIRQTLIDLAGAGTAILVISEDLDELFQICDRLAVIDRGRLSPAKPVSETSLQEIGLLIGGGQAAYESSVAR